jgi:hypothetical protein
MNSYTVHVNQPAHQPWPYSPSYFPRKFSDKAAAIQCAKDAIAAGAPRARVECPDGSELDFDWFTPKQRERSKPDAK